jgi:hypothetical protein
VIAPEELVGEEWAAWYRLSPVERWRKSEQLWEIYFRFGGSLDPNPILKVLSLICVHRVHALLMGGKACVFYGAAEFSRDTDLAILASSENLARLKKALKDLQAEVIAVPPFEAKYLRKGHAA